MKTFILAGMLSLTTVWGLIAIAQLADPGRSAAAAGFSSPLGQGILEETAKNAGSAGHISGVL
jgi:hypothetical protein